MYHPSEAQTLVILRSWLISAVLNAVFTVNGSFCNCSYKWFWSQWWRYLAHFDSMWKVMNTWEICLLAFYSTCLARSVLDPSVLFTGWFQEHENLMVYSGFQVSCWCVGPPDVCLNVLHLMMILLWNLVRLNSCWDFFWMLMMLWSVTNFPT